MAEERRLIIPAVLERIPEACGFVIEAAEQAGLNERAVYHCQMAVDEWCTNIVEHGFCYEGADGRIEIACRNQAEQFVVVISDNSPAFNPMALPEAELDTDLEKRKVGGLGWFFIRKVMDDVRYEYREGYNRLTLIKYGAQPKLTVMTHEQPDFPISQRSDGTTVMTAHGRLDLTAARKLETALTEHFNAPNMRLVLDMSAVSYISSGGLKALLTVKKHAQKRESVFILAGMNERVREIFEMSGFDSLFTIASTVDEAADLG
jgi:anti-anti-sigma factor